MSDFAIYMDVDTKSLKELSHMEFYNTFSKLVYSKVKHSHC